MQIQRSLLVDFLSWEKVAFPLICTSALYRQLWWITISPFLNHPAAVAASSGQTKVLSCVKFDSLCLITARQHAIKGIQWLQFSFSCSSVRWWWRHPSIHPLELNSAPVSALRNRRFSLWPRRRRRWWWWWNCGAWSKDVSVYIECAVKWVPLNDLCNARGALLLMDGQDRVDFPRQEEDSWN